MRIIARVLGWTGLAFSRLVVAFAPVLIVTGMGFFYLWSLLDALLAPGVGVEYFYETEAGITTAKAASYRIDLFPLRADVFGLEIIDPLGGVAAKADRLTATQKNSGFDIAVGHGTVAVERLEDGSLSIQRALPKPGEAGEGPAVSFSVRQIDVSYLDRAGARPIERELVLSGLEGISASGDLNVKFIATDDDLKSVPFEIQNDPAGGVWISASFQDAEIAPILPVLMPWMPKDQSDQLAKTTVRSLIADGKARVYTKGDIVQIDGSFQAVARQLAVRGVFPALDAEIKADGTDGFLNVVASARRPGVSGAFDGVAVFGNQMRIDCRTQVAVKNRAALWKELTRGFPNEADFSNGRFDGTVRLVADKAWVRGDFRADQASWQKEIVTQLSADFSASPELVGATIKTARWNGFDLTGGGTYGLKDDKLGGFIQTSRGRLEPIAKQFGFSGVRGVGFAQAVLGGTGARPQASVFARGSGGLSTGGEGDLFVRSFEARAQIDQDGAIIHRAIVDSPNGMLTASGKLGFKDNGLDLIFQGSGLNLGAFIPDLDGLGYAQGTVAGTINNPVLKGMAEAYGVAYAGQKSPQIKTDFGYQEGVFSVSDLFARVGAGWVRGQGTYSTQDDLLAGTFNGEDIQLGAFTEGALIGWAALENGGLAGTLANPLVTAEASARDLVAGGYRFDSAQTDLTFQSNQVLAENLEVVAGPGLITGEGQIALDTLQASATFNAQRIPLGRLPTGDDSFDIRGLAEAQGTASWSPEKGPEVNAEGTIQNAALNGTPIGSGGFTINVADSLAVGTMEIGDIERYLRLNHMQYDFESGAIKAEADVYNFSIETLTEIFQNSFATIPDWMREAIEETEGSITGSVEALGYVNDPDAAIKGLHTENLKIKGRDAGEVVLDAERRAGEWTINQATWDAEEFALRASGTVQESGPIDLKLDGANVDLSWISTLVPDTPNLLGRSSIYAEAKGTLNNPDILASIQASLTGIVQPDGTQLALPSSKNLVDQYNNPIQQPLELNLERVTFSNRLAQAEGFMRWEGFTGNLTARVPLDALENDAKAKGAEEASAKLVLVERPIMEFRDLFRGGLDESSDGTVKGEIVASGYSGDFHVNGEVLAAGNRLDVNNLETALMDYSVRVGVQDERVTLQAAAKSEEGGTANADLIASLNGILSGGNEAEDLVDRATIAGTLVLDRFKLEQRLPNSSDPSAVQANGSLSIRGNFREPRIGGSVDLSGVDLRLPTEFPQGGEGAPLPIDPYFDHLTINMDEGSRVSVAIGNLRIHGSGDINGPLSALQVRAPMVVDSGRLELPTSRITLEEGGEILLIYRGEQGNPDPLRVDINLEGRSTATARRFGDQYETYDLYLTFRGNLINPDGIAIEGYSDPPDLSRDEILAIIGQRQLLETLAQTAFGDRDDQFLRDTLYSIAVPTLTRQFTQGIADSIHLDYITLDYNPFDQAILRVGKTLTKGLILQYSKQLSEPAFGRQKYELKLSYRPPSRTGVLSRFRLSIGLDQDRPWKVSLDWARRF